MKSNSFRPERRNRKIGTKSSGYKKSNKMVVPNGRSDGKVWHLNDLNPSYTKVVSLHDSEVTIIYETPYEGFSYGCSPEDVIYLLEQLPNEDCYCIEFIVFRQPTRKQAQLEPVWGRMQYGITINGEYGAAIYLEAAEIGKEIRWSRKLDAEDQAELKRLREDGHQITETKRHYFVTPSEASIRNTLLYRTLFHELGHWVQFEREVYDDNFHPLLGFVEAYDIYFSKPKSEHESFAHRYAKAVGDYFRLEQIIPFESKGQ